jgi:hypothetical protein
VDDDADEMLDELDMAGMDIDREGGVRLKYKEQLVRPLSFCRPSLMLRGAATDSE